MLRETWPARIVDGIGWGFLLGLIVWTLRTGGCSWN